MSFGITYAVVEDAAAQMRNQTAQLTQVVAEMRRRAETLFTQWEGKAEMVYAETQTKWQSQAGTMNGDLEANIARLRLIVANYQDGDSRAAGSM